MEKEKENVGANHLGKFLAAYPQATSSFPIASDGKTGGITKKTEEDTTPKKRRVAIERVKERIDDDVDNGDNVNSEGTNDASSYNSLFNTFTSPVRNFTGKGSKQVTFKFPESSNALSASKKQKSPFGERSLNKQNVCENTDVGASPLKRLAKDISRVSISKPPQPQVRNFPSFPIYESAPVNSAITTSKQVPVDSVSVTDSTASVKPTIKAAATESQQPPNPFKSATSIRPPAAPPPNSMLSLIEERRDYIKKDKVEEKGKSVEEGNGENLEDKDNRSPMNLGKSRKFNGPRFVAPPPKPKVEVMKENLRQQKEEYAKQQEKEKELQQKRKKAAEEAAEMERLYQEKKKYVCKSAITALLYKGSRDPFSSNEQSPLGEQEEIMTKLAREVGLESGKIDMSADKGNISDSNKGRRAVPIVPLTSMSSIQSKMKLWKEKYGKPQEPLPLPRSPSPKPVSREELEQHADGKSSINELSGVGENKAETHEECDIKEEVPQSKEFLENTDLESVLDSRKEVKTVKAEEKSSVVVDTDADDDMQIKKTAAPFADTKGHETKDRDFEDKQTVCMQRRSWRRLKDNGEEKMGGVDDKDIDAYLERRRSRMVTGRSQARKEK